MTCILALKHNDNIWVGGDSVATDGNYNLTTKQPKVFKINDLLFGATSSFRMMQIIQHHLEFESFAEYTKNRENVSLETWLVKHVVEEIRQKLKSFGYTRMIDSNQESVGTCIVAIGNRMFLMDSDLQIIEIDGNCWAIGHGAEWAVGACHALLGTGMHSKEIIEKSLSISCQYSPFVKPPFVIEHTQKT